jgi:hypothetical protein
MESKALLELILAVAGDLEDGRKSLACAQAFQLSTEHDVSLKEIARVCNQNRIKFIQCQLGCF